MEIVQLEDLGLSRDKLKSIKDTFISKGHNYTVYKNRSNDSNIITERCKDAEIVILSNIPFGKDVINACPNLKLIDVAFTGVDHIDLDACKERGITVCNAAGYSTNSVAELAIGLIISVYRKIVLGDAQTRKQETSAGFIGTELNGKTIGIIGTGAIGLRVAEIAKVFGCNIIAYSRTEKNIEGITFVSLEELLKRSDIVSLHIPFTKETKNFITKEHLEMMKEDAIIINTARGKVINSQDLADALNNNVIAGAATDVYEMEPPIPKEHPLLNAKNIVTTPHVAFATKEAFIKRWDIVEVNIDKWIDGVAVNVVG